MAGSSSAGISTRGKAVETGVGAGGGNEEASAMYPMLFTSLSSLELPGLGVRVTASGEEWLQHLGEGVTTSVPRLQLSQLGSKKASHDWSH